MKVTVARKSHFNAAHRLFHPSWSDEKNFEIFGKCSNPNYHGHNYNLEVKVKGEVDAQTGFVMDMKWLKEIIESEISDYLDHKNLNLEIPEFRNLNPTAENISIVIWNKLKAHLPQGMELSVVLYETERNFVEYSGT